jgi:hypothetical protein
MIIDDDPLGGAQVEAYLLRMPHYQTTWQTAGVVRFDTPESAELAIGWSPRDNARSKMTKILRTDRQKPSDLRRRDFP